MLRLAVLVSGTGSNLRVLLERAVSGDTKATIECVIADRPCDAKSHADEFNVPFIELPQGNTSDKQSRLNELLPMPADNPYGVEAVVLAGYLSILTTDFCKRWAGRIINLHPALLPNYGGKGMWGHHVHEAVLAKQPRDNRSGATVHFVTPKIDDGDILIQSSCPVIDTDTVESLQIRVQKIEHHILPVAVNLLAEELTQTDVSSVNT